MTTDPMMKTPEKTDQTKKTNAEPTAGAKPEGMMNSVELFEHIKTLDGRYKAHLNCLRSQYRTAKAREEIEA